MARLESNLKNIETNVQQNPAMAETEFDKSLSMKKIRQTVDLNGGLTAATNARGAIAAR